MDKYGDILLLIYDYKNSIIDENFDQECFIYKKLTNEIDQLTKKLQFYKDNGV